MAKLWYEILSEQQLGRESFGFLTPLQCKAHLMHLRGPKSVMTHSYVNVTPEAW